ncbi:MAG: DNA mismatch repair endonuclease MutL [Clostridiaceae bacterium]|nr:DNA mismatch repair endonuclease MutL [Clostridiaceae bacterium]
MAKIHVLSQDTVNKIAAGEVIERPMAVVKELVENAVDAMATAVTVEINDGGKALIRVTDNGSGMAAGDIDLAFLPHATSKIEDAADLLSVSSLGFRGEALSSIASVSQLEMITKTKEELMGVRCMIDGGEKKLEESVGCPDGTTFLIRNLFYNTPARLKFLKTSQTEAGYISGLVERMALSHPDISFRFINQKQTKLSTSGNGNLKDVIYHIFGREITSNLIEINQKAVFFSLSGFIGKPVVSRGNRGMMNYFINGRYVKSQIVQRAIEEAYAPYTMQHRYPFTALHIQIDPKLIDVNVHPQKMELRFVNEKEMFQGLFQSLSEALKNRELIPEVTFQKEKKQPLERKNEYSAIEPFEKQRRSKLEQQKRSFEPERQNLSAPEQKRSFEPERQNLSAPEQKRSFEPERQNRSGAEQNTVSGTEEKTSCLREAVFYGNPPEVPEKAVQENLFDTGILSPKIEKEIQIIGQVFSTYWILQYEDSMYLVDQHAAHEKVLYERFLKETLSKEPMSQLLQPPVILTLSMAQQQAVEEHGDMLKKLGYQIDPFGGKEYAVSGVPAHLPSVGTRELLLDVIDSLTQELGRNNTPELLLEKLASMSCKAAVKGNSQLPAIQMEELLKELMQLENPYHCPHGRPTMIRISKRELEKKFKRIV